MPLPRPASSNGLLIPSKVLHTFKRIFRLSKRPKRGAIRESLTFLLSNGCFCAVRWLHASDVTRTRLKNKPAGREHFFFEQTWEQTVKKIHFETTSQEEGGDRTQEERESRRVSTKSSESNRSKSHRGSCGFVLGEKRRTDFKGTRNEAIASTKCEGCSLLSCACRS